MKKYIEILGSMIEHQTQTNPDRARALLTAAYSWVRFSSKRSRLPDLRSAYGRINSTVAGTIVDSFRHPQDAVMVNLFMPCELLHAMDLTPMFPEGIAGYVACTACQKGFAEAAESSDVPETFCSYHKTMLGMADMGVLPKPMMIVNTTLACDANQLSFRHLANFFQVPHTVIDVPYTPDEEAVQYVANQLRSLVPQMEDLSNRRLDRDALKQAVACSQRTISAHRAYLARRGSVSLPTTVSGEMFSLIATHVLLGHPEAEQYMNELLRFANQAPTEQRFSKKRIYWIHVLPNWQESMCSIFDAGGRCEIVGSDMSMDYIGDMDPQKPFESMARRVVQNTCNGPAERRITAAIHHAAEARTDGIVLFCHWGCKQTMGLSQLAKQSFEAAGFPTLVLDGDGCDSRNVADGQMVTRVNAFLEQLEGLA